MPIDEVFLLTPKQAFNMIKYYYEDRADIFKSVIKIIEGVLGVKKRYSAEDKNDRSKNETIQKTPALDRMSKDHMEKLRNLKNGRKASN
jgi:hypothetical protein